MAWIEPVLVGLILLGSAWAFGYVLWTQRLGHVWPKRGEVRITNPRWFLSRVVGGPFPECRSEEPALGGPCHLPLFFGLLAFLFKSLLHVLAGLGMEVEAPDWYNRLLDVVAVLVLVAIVFLVIRRYFVEREKMTHLVESGVILALIALLMITHLLEQIVVGRVGCRRSELVGPSPGAGRFSRPSSPTGSICTWCWLR